jgi:alkaline phosphatase
MSPVWIVAALSLLPSSSLAADEAPVATNIILMVADGAGYNTWKASAMYEGTAGRELHDSEGWVRLAVAPRLQVQASEAHRLKTEDGSLVYDPAKAWDPTPTGAKLKGSPAFFEGYRWLQTDYPDSAGTMTTVVTGVTSYRGAINVDPDGNPIENTIARLSKNAGMRVGVVTSTQWSHATPAVAAGAHHAGRFDYCPLAVDILADAPVDLLAGCGHPEFDNNGRRIKDPSARQYRYVGGREVWEALSRPRDLVAGDVVCAGLEGQAFALTERQARNLGSWRLVSSKKKIEKLARKPARSRLLIVPEVGQSRGPDGKWVGGTLQQQRDSRGDPGETPPGHDPFIATVPSLETLTEVALEALGRGPGGFFLHVEGGAVDWAMHDNQIGRMIEEMIEFRRAVEAVVGWIDRHEAWDRTLLIVTSDHDQMLWGPRADEVPFDPLHDNGPGKMPGHRWLSGGHSNALVPLFAKGVGAERFADHADREDPVRGSYLDQADIFTVMESVLPSRP